MMPITILGNTLCEPLGGYQERKPGVLYESWGGVLTPLWGIENSHVLRASDDMELSSRSYRIAGIIQRDITGATCADSGRLL